MTESLCLPSTTALRLKRKKINEGYLGTGTYQATFTHLMEAPNYLDDTFLPAADFFPGVFSNGLILANVPVGKLTA